MQNAASNSSMEPPSSTGQMLLASRRGSALVIVAMLLAGTGTARADGRRGRVQRIVAAMLGGVSSGVFAVGAAHAIGAAYDNHLAASQCPDLCTPDGQRLEHRAATLRLAAQMLLATSAMGILGAVVLWRGARVEAVAAVSPGQVATSFVVRF
jgi:hypothetical protein